MYAFYRQVHVPTSVEHCLYCNFFSSSEKNLITAGVNQLNVYRLNADAEPSTSSRGQQEKATDGRVKKKKLECLANFSLFGNVMCMQSVRLTGATRDSLLLSFREAKLSLLDYDPHTHDLKTTSLHYFEEEEMKNGSIQHSFQIPLVRVDPEGRCAAMLIYGTKLVILPFRKDTQTDDLDLTASNRPVMSSYIIELTKFDDKITNVVDFQFLYGYYEPTIFILFEPLPTWAGRVAVRRDTCSIVAISLNLQQKAHPVIWSLSGLPFDCFQVLPVEKPIGGVLVFAVNSLFYLNQSVPPFGVSLNGLTDFSTEFLLKPQEGMKISLDCCQASFITHDKLVISLKSGELYVLTLLVDGMRAVRSFNFDKAAASVLTTCMIQCDAGYLFLGSRLGNSLLLKYTEKLPEDLETAKESSSKDKEDEPPSKKKKTEALEDWIASDVSALDDLDELEVYGKDTQAGVQITAYSFEVCDSILNIGPCGQMVVGEPAFLSEEFNNLLDPDLELVTTTGFGKNGALSVLQKSVRPQVVTTFELPGCTDMWTVKGPPVDSKPEGEKENEENQVLEGGDALLVMSREDSSMVLQTGQEIMELDHSGFSTQGPTVFAGNIGNNKYIVQVSPMGVRLLDGVKQLQHIPIDVGSPIVSCSVADPYVLIMSEAGQVMQLSLRYDATGGARLQILKTQLPQNSGILTLCAYRDVSGMFTTEMEDEETLLAKSLSAAKTPTKLMADNSNMPDKGSVDDEDELLYGDSDISMFASEPGAKKEESSEGGPSPDDLESPTSQDVKPTYWAVVGRENGSLEIYSLPDLRLSFAVKNFQNGHRVLVDTVTLSDSGLDKPLTNAPEVKELLLVGLGNREARPFLLARVDEELFVYEAFRHTGSITNRLKLRFRKHSHGLILKERRAAKKKSDVDDDDRRELDSIKWLRPFSDISGYSGVFVSGPYPHWLFMTSRGILRTHPMGIDGAITCFSPFHNVNCPKGFLYFNRQGELRISVLPTHLSYDAPWPVRKVPLRCTPHFVLYHPESKTYSVISSTNEVNCKVVRIQSEGDKEFETQERDERFIFPTIEKFSAQLFSPVSWEAIPNTRYELEDFEHITCAKAVNLVSEGTVSGLKGYIAMATNYSYSEDVTSRGRIIIYDVIEVVPEPGQPLTKNKMKIEYDKEQKGPVTALDHVQGFLVTAIGQKIYIWTLKDQDLSGVAFIDTQIYIHSITSIKSLILCADIFKSISLLRYQTDMKVLSLVSRDIKPLEVYNTNFMVDNANLCFVVSDRDKNLIIFAYQPDSRESHGGQRLLRRADINIGSHANSFFRIRCKLTDPSTDKKAPSSAEMRHITYLCTLDGSLSQILPISEKVYRRLLMLQNVLIVQIPHYAGLNPKAYRTLVSEQRFLSNPQRNVLDGDLLWLFLSLARNERIELSKRIGTSPDQIIEDLMEIDRYAAHF